MATEIGSLGGGAIQQTKRTYEAQGQKTIEYVLNSNDESTFLGSFSVGTSLDSGLYLASIETTAFKGVTRATLKYVPFESLLSGGYGPTGVTSKASDSNAAELPIEENPNYSPSWETTKPGVTSYLAPQPTYTYTQIVSSFTFSEANIIDGVGALSNPTGMTSPTANAWLKTSKTVTPQGDKFEITETWQCAGLDGATVLTWDTDIY